MLLTRFKGIETQYKLSELFRHTMLLTRFKGIETPICILL